MEESHVNRRTERNLEVPGVLTRRALELHPAAGTVLPHPGPRPSASELETGYRLSLLLTGRCDPDQSRIRRRWAASQFALP